MTSFRWQADKVRIRSTPETEAAGVATLTGIVVGETKPSSSGAQVIGPCPGDYAIGVLIPALRQAVWLPPEQLEKIGSEEVTGGFGTAASASRNPWHSARGDPLHQALDWLLRRLGLGS